MHEFILDYVSTNYLPTNGPLKIVIETFYYSSAKESHIKCILLDIGENLSIKFIQLFMRTLVRDNSQLNALCSMDHRRKL